jgi:hypothetical protein
LYSDQDEVLFGSTRPIVVNGIDEIAIRSDLADRSIRPALSPIPERDRKLESELWDEFERQHPLILGALLDAVSHGLRTLPDVKLDCKPRMADFAVWIAACEGALWKKGAFMAAYANNVEEAIEVVLEADQVATALRAYMEKNPEFVGTASELLQALNTIVPEPQKKAKGWPKRPNTLSSVLRRAAPPLRKVGIDIRFEREGSKRWLTITRPDNLGKTSSPSSSPSLFSGLNGLEGAGDRHPIVTASGGIVTDDAGDDPGDDQHGGVVTGSALKDKGNDDGDGNDDPLLTLTGVGPNGKGKADEDRSCRQCGGPVDGTEQLVKIDGQPRWLHPECSSYLGRCKEQES